MPTPIPPNKPNEETLADAVSSYINRHASQQTTSFCSAVAKQCFMASAAMAATSMCLFLSQGPVSRAFTYSYLSGSLFGAGLPLFTLSLYQSRKKY